MNLLTLFRRSNHSPLRAAVHMTAAHTRQSTLNRTGVFVKANLWIFPIVAVLVLAVAGWGMRRSIESTMKANLRSQLETLLNVETSMLDTWLKVQMNNASSLANDGQVRELVYELLAAVDPTQPLSTPLVASPIHARLTKELGPAMTADDYYGYVVLDRNRKVLSATASELIGRDDLTEQEAAIRRTMDRAFDGDAAVSPPFPSVTMMRDEKGRLRTGVPAMFVCAPVRDDSFQVVAVLGLRIRPEREFTRILQLGRMGESGETYAFDATGRMVSGSRFDNDLILIGLLPDQEDARSILNLSVRDPGGNMTQGFRPKKRRHELPLTKMAVLATAGGTGVDVEGYNDYRGVPVLGAWTWLPALGVGVSTEIDSEEAFRPLVVLQITFWILFALLVLCAIALFAFTVVHARMRREAQIAAIAAKKLGQYRLEEKLGAGGMGIVYKGYHAILRRPTAIKMLQVDRVTDSSIDRFEREVQLTCQLNNPHTVAIYDYGRTDEGVFYYAMEYLDGIDLQALVDKYGPQPEGRVIRILSQMCGSLFEAHSLGLVHRDIKPANVMLNRRGGEPDVAKVLDFGLVKALDEGQQQALTMSNGLTGTPMYMSPEAIQTPQSVDPRSDLYAVGAVGYFLLTGKPVFDAASIVELCQLHVSQPPMPPSHRPGCQVSADFEAVLLACLEKSRAKRPQTARELAQRLAQVREASHWTIDDADAWWGRHERGGRDTSPATMAPSADKIATPPGTADETTDKTYVPQ